LGSSWSPLLESRVIVAHGWGAGGYKVDKINRVIDRIDVCWEAT